MSYLETQGVSFWITLKRPFLFWQNYNETVAEKNVIFGGQTSHRIVKAFLLMPDDISESFNMFLIQ